MKFCDRLKEVRKASPFTQKILAEKLGISLTAYQYYESGRNAPSLENLVLLADLFDISLDYLACRDDFLAKHADES